MEHKVRHACEIDAAAINNVSKHLGYSELSVTDTQEKLSNLIQSSTDEIYVAEVRDCIVGWLHIFYAHRLASANFYEIGGLVVLPDYRGRGVGRVLVKHAEDLHQGKMRVRCNELRLEAHKFYKSIGFHSTKNQQVFEK